MLSNRFYPQNKVFDSINSFYLLNGESDMYGCLSDNYMPLGGYFGTQLEVIWLKWSDQQIVTLHYPTRRNCICHLGDFEIFQDITKADRLQHELYSYENKWPFALNTYLELTPLVWLSEKNQ